VYISCIEGGGDKRRFWISDIADKRPANTARRGLLWHAA
jgi:hypothetical protein